jgi:acyl carrier protein
MMSNKDSVRAKIAEVLGHKAEVIMDDAVLTDLVNNSFLLVELVIELQEEFDVRFQQADMNEVKTAGALIDLVDSRIAADT